MLGNVICMALSGRSGVVSTKRTLPCSTTYEARSRRPVSARQGNQLHAEGGAIKVGGLSRVADVKLDIIVPFSGRKSFFVALAGCSEDARR